VNVNEPVNLGLIGYGLWGAHHARAIDGAEHARLAAIAVPSESSRAAAAEAWPGVDVHDDYRDLIARDDIDAVSVVVPNHLHYEIGLTVLQTGKHLLIEKPMTLDAAKCDALIAAANERSLVLAVNHEMRLSSLWGRVRSLIDEGTIGRPQYVLIELSRFPYRQGSHGWRYDIGRVGNWILEEPIHFFDLARWYFQGYGEPVSVYARASARDPQQPELQDNFSAVVEFTGGGYAVVTQTLAAFEHHVTCKVTGTLGAILAAWSAPDARSPQPKFALRYSVGDQLTDVAFEASTGEVVELAQQIESFVRAIREGTPPAVSGEDGRWSVLLCQAAQASVDCGGVVEIETFIPRTRTRSD